MADAPHTVEDLLAVLLPGLAPVAETETVTLRRALGRILAADLVAADPVPPFSRSAVDGYALAGLNGEGAELALRGRLAAGDMPDGIRCGDGAVRIFTGAAIPFDCDRVAMQEDCAADAIRVRINRPIESGANIRSPGSDLPAGALALAAGVQLDPRRLAVAASLGRDRLEVRRRIHVGIVTTGDELIEPGRPLAAGRIYDSNRPLLQGMLDAVGIDTVDLGHAADDPGALAQRLEAGRGCDAVITTGGVSVGDEDHVRAVVEAHGGRIEHWRLAIKPGKPVAVGRMAGGALFLGLPGNPNAVFCTMALIGLPLLRALEGQTYVPPSQIDVQNAVAFRRIPGRREYVPVRLEGTCAIRLGSGDSAQQAALAAADALMVIPADLADVPAGSRFPAIPIAALIG